jgi:hypothetical protein
MSVTRQEPVPAGMVHAAGPGGVLGDPSHYDREIPPRRGRRRRCGRVSETTVRSGVFELEVGGDPLPPGHVRHRGGGGSRPTTWIRTWCRRSWGWSSLHRDATASQWCKRGPSSSGRAVAAHWPQRAHGAAARGEQDAQTGRLVPENRHVRRMPHPPRMTSGIW